MFTVQACSLCCYSVGSIKQLRNNGTWMKQIVSLCFKLPSRDVLCYDRDKDRICPRVYICVCVCVTVCAMFMMQKFAVKYLSRRGTMCIFLLVNVCFSLVTYFFIPLPFSCFRLIGSHFLCILSRVLHRNFFPCVQMRLF
jgi:hypothetical protein